MFALRGTVIGLAVFATVYCTMSFTVLLAWRKLRSYGLRFHASWRADLLFALRLLPLISAVLLTAVVAVPSFLILEPRSIEERLGIAPIGMGLLGVAVVIVGFGKAAAALSRASRMIARWTRGGQTLGTSGSIPVMQVSQEAPAMTGAGILCPRILLSEAAASQLTRSEFYAALNHERAHVRKRDNLRKLLLQFVAFPGMNGLEAAWIEAAEMAADDSAVSNVEDALDLASALIKLSRCAPLRPPGELTAALVHSPASLVDARVKRLLVWEEKSPADRKLSIGRVVMVGGIALSLFAFCYAPLLVRVHAATEWLVR
jgi:Zn-dependent protease with chaperone function